MRDMGDLCISNGDRLVHDEEEKQEGILLPLPHFPWEVCNKTTRHHCNKCELSICLPVPLTVRLACVRSCIRHGKM